MVGGPCLRTMSPESCYNGAMTKLKLYSWNVNGIRAAERKGFLNWLEHVDADIVAIQETKAQPEQLSEELLKVDGFQSFWTTPNKKGYSGVALYSKVAPSSVVMGLGDEQLDGDGRTIIAEYDGFVVINCYFPNGGRGPEWVAHKLGFYKRFLEVVAGYHKRGLSVIATGDVNTAYAEIDIARPKENAKKSGFMPEEREALGEFFKAGLIDTFRLLHPEQVKYSWWDQKTLARERGVGWRLDYFFVTPELKNKIKAADIDDTVLGSDHAPILLELA